MHILGITFLLAYLLYANLAMDPIHSDYYDDYESDSSPQPDMEQRLRSASTVDELMSLMYPSFWAALKCKSKLTAAGSGSRLRYQAQTQTQTQRSRPRSGTEEPTYAAAYLNLDMLKSIESEWRKTQCSPREVCVDVAREFGTPTNLFYKPPCVSVSRCGGCCHSEDKQCRNISTGYVSKTLFEITVPITQGTKPVTISVANHTQCSCLSKLDVFKQVHSIIRRALPECPVANRTCPRAQTWSSRLCRCVSSGAYYNPPPPQNARPTRHHNDFLSSDVCGSDRELDAETCQCVCRLPDRPCPPRRRWDSASCQCVCSAPSGHSCPPHFTWDSTSCQCVCSAPSGHSCPPHFTWDSTSCQCVCAKSCPHHQPLNPARCACECSESPNKCFLRGRRFHPATCSCVRAPCEVRRRRCEPGFVFSEEVCRCIPSHWRRLD
uniref:Platelet-derived growth factor (PDGF) family profile domain-containing protein n=2 Tax=Knipowitschia caucasica TaxID=637954 RepID=A0AAV2LJJ9_KNICA